MSFRTALKESVKSAKTTGNFGSKNFAVFVYVLSVSLVCLQVNVHVVCLLLRFILLQRNDTVLFCGLTKN